MELVFLTFVFVLAVFLGFELINKVPFNPSYAIDVRVECDFRYYAGRCTSVCRH